MIRTLAKSIREYKKPSILAPVFVTGEVIMECIIPFIIANLVNEIKAGISMPVAGLWRFGRESLLHRQLRFCPQPAQGYVLQNSGLLL